jgi:enoyl-CoA hydratase
MNRLSHTLSLVRSSTLSATPRPTLVHFARAMSQSAAATQGDKLVLAERKGPVLVLTLNRPKALNALSSPLFEQLNGEFAKAQVDDEVRAVVLTGGEKNFAGEFEVTRRRRHRRGGNDHERSERTTSERSGAAPSGARSNTSEARMRNGATLPSAARSQLPREGRPTR